MVSVRSHRAAVRKSQKKCTGVIASITRDSKSMAPKTDRGN